MIDFKKIKRAHFIGIGGIGVSAIARMLLELGAQVTGSDASGSEITEELSSRGATLFSGHREENLMAAGFIPDLVVFTIAIASDNPELALARSLQIPCFSYPEILGELTKNYFTIAVSGTHGKTTTTAMVAKIMIDAGLDPTVIVGSLLLEGFSKGSGKASNFIAGKSKYLVLEACEYRRSFLNLHPDIIVITNIDNDHLDYYKDLEEIKEAFGEFEQRLKPSGKVVKSLKSLQSLKLRVPGKHNQENASAALAVAEILKIPESTARASLENFSGTWRRFEYKGKTQNGALVYNDYAHHPTEIRATLAGARELYPKNKIIAVFQPHLYSRTKILLQEFAQSFKEAEEVIVTDIYAAREALDPSIHALDLVRNLKRYGAHGHYIKNFDQIKMYLSGHTQTGDIVITMGAGDVHKICS